MTKTAGNRNSFDEPIADAQTDKLVNVAIDVSALQSFYMVSDQAVTIETNDGTTPQETIVLKANEPLSWIKGSNQLGGADYPAVPFGGDVTAFFVTNASGSAAQLKIEILQDPTP
ncbi:MAG: hypothetical protein U0990_09510 [Candidatus Nanopelagicales bacterium]|nr:hypothetical protein [Candidatus Nanopelagicales bacterium]